MLGLLSTKDLILVDPEDAMSVDMLLAHCGRDLLTVWFDTPVRRPGRECTDYTAPAYPAALFPRSSRLGEYDADEFPARQFPPRFRAGVQPSAGWALGGHWVGAGRRWVGGKASEYTGW